MLREIQCLKKYLDVLDDLSQAPPSTASKPAHTKKEEKSKSTTISEEDPAEPDLDELLGGDDFAKQLAANMEQLMGEMSNEDNDELKQAFEKVWASFDGGEATTADQKTTSREVPKAPASFQDTIGKTLNKLKDSSKEIDVS